MRLTLFALKNIGRNKRRTAAIVGMTALGGVALLLAGGYAAATFRGLRENTVRNGVGHLQIAAPGFRDGEEKPLSRGLADLDAARHIVLADKRVRAAAGRIEFTGLASNGEKSVAVLGRGVEPEQEYERAGFTLTMLQGRPLASSDDAEAVAGEGLARSLGLSVGDRLTVLSTTVDGAINGLDTVIVGVYTTGIRELDERSLLVRLDTAQALLDTRRVSKLVVLLNHTADTEAVRADLGSAFTRAGQDVELATWSDLATFYHQVRGLYSGIFVFLGFIIVGLVVLSASNAMTMAVLERVREIGTQMAMGTGRLRILWMFVVEGIGLGVLGGALACGLGYTAAVLLTRAQIPMPPPPTFTRGFPLVIDVVPALYVSVAVLIVATLGIASLLPAARAARLRITEALGHV
jgi:putative ABC transport system permease protein